MSTRHFYGIREKKPVVGETPDARNHLIGNQMITRPGIIKDNTEAQGYAVMDIGHLKSDDCNTTFGLAITDDGNLRPTPITPPVESNIEYTIHSDLRTIAGDTGASYSGCRENSGAHTAGVAISQSKIAGFFNTARGFILFDTSAIPDAATITDVKLKMQASSISTDVYVDIMIHEFDWENPVTTANREANYDGALAATEGAVIWKNTEDIVVDTYYTSPSLDISRVNKRGYTKYALVGSGDVDAVEPFPEESEGATIDMTVDKPILLVQYKL